MAIEEENPSSKPSSSSTEDALSALISSYLGLSFSVFLGFLPRSSLSHIASLQSRNRILSLKLFHAEEQLRQMRSRRKEDSKANARVVEIFASHRHAWQQEEKGLLNRIDAAADEIASLRLRISELERSEAELRSSVDRLQRELNERDEMLELMSRTAAAADAEGREEGMGKKEVDEVLDGEEEDEREYFGDYTRMARVRFPEGLDPAAEPYFVERREDLDDLAVMYFRQNGFGPDFMPPSATSLPWTQSPKGLWQDTKLDPHESIYDVKHNVARREYPWKVRSDAAGVSSKLKLLEQELSNVENVEKGLQSKLPTLLRKQARRYKSLAGKIDDLCNRMQLSDVFEPSLSPNFRTQRQTEFLAEALRLQHQAKEIRQKLNALQAEVATAHLGAELTGEDKLIMRKSLDSIRTSFKEIQRNLEIWLARIMGDLEGILARDGASRVRDYYLSRYPFNSHS